MQKYFIYCRKSSESEDRQVLSIESQVNEIQTLARKLGLTVSEVFKESMSAREPGRPIFSEMVKRLNRGEAQGILCWKLDRLARNPIDGAQIIWALRQNGTKIITPNQTYSYNEDTTILMYLEFGMAQKYVDDLSKNVRRGNRAKLEKGELPGAAPIGYMNYTDQITKEVTLIPDKERFPIVRKMWDLMLSGTCSVREVVSTANIEWGLRTRKTKRRGGKPIAFSYGYSLLTNPFYCGTIKRPEGKFEHKYKRMVSRDEFDRVQEILGGKSKSRGKKYEFAFTGLIRCGECGCSITAEEKSKFVKSDGLTHHYTYYRCTKKKRDAKCSQPTITVGNLEAQIADFLDRIHIPKNLMSWAIAEADRQKEKSGEARQAVLIRLEKVHSQSQRSLETLTDLRLRELITDEEFSAKRKKLETERDETIKGMKKVSEPGEGLDQAAQNIFVFAHYSKIWLKKGNLTTQKKVAEYFGSNWTLKDKKLSTVLKKPFLVIEDSLKGIKTNNRRLEPSECLSTQPYNGKFESLFPKLWAVQGSNL